MASHTGKIDMIRGSIIKSAALFALPICVGNILQQLYGTVDTLVVGNFLSIPPRWRRWAPPHSQWKFCCACFLGIGNGASILVSQEMGRRNADGLRMLVRTAVWFFVSVRHPGHDTGNVCRPGAAAADAGPGRCL